jgi:hypothetical protein
MDLFFSILNAPARRGAHSCIADDLVHLTGTAAMLAFFTVGERALAPAFRAHILARLRGPGRCLVGRARLGASKGALGSFVVLIRLLRFSRAARQCRATRSVARPLGTAPGEIIVSRLLVIGMFEHRHQALHHRSVVLLERIDRELREVVA